MHGLAWHDLRETFSVAPANTTPRCGLQYATQCDGMTDDLADRIVSFLDAHHVMSLATIGQDGPHAASLFYVRDRFALIWLSDPASRHSVHIDARPNVAATIAPDYCDFPEIQGLQICGQAERIRTELDQVRARKCLQTRYPFLQNASAGLRELRDAYDHAQIYRLHPARIVLIDNKRGFGSKEILDLTSANGARSA